MKPAQAVDDVLVAVRRIVLAAVIGGCVGAAIVLVPLTRPGVGQEFAAGLAVLFLFLTVPIGTCVGGAVGVIVVLTAGFSSQPAAPAKTESMSHKRLALEDEWGLD